MSERTSASASSPKAAASPAASGAPGGLTGYQQPGASDILRLRKLFEAEEFDQLNRVLVDKLEAVKRNIGKEPQLLEAYQAFERDDSAWNALFDRWISQHPQQYQGYLARATYLVHRGWKARGGAYSNETPKENMVRMMEFMGRAQTDLAQALNLEGDALWAYCLRIRIAKAGGNSADAFRAMEQATARYPATYLARKYYLETLDPKWGGTPLAMIGFAKGAQHHAGSNPRLRELVSYAYYEAGRMAYIEKDYVQARDLLSIAIDQGGRPRSHFVRGKSHARLGDHDKALADFNAAISHNREDGDYYYWRARSFAAIKRYDESLMDIQRAHALKPDDKWINRFRLKLVSLAATPQIAAPAGQQTGSAGSSGSAESLFGQAKRLIEGNQPEQAKVILDRAIKMNPGEFRYYQLIDHALFKQGKLRDILGYWESYLAIRPNDARAYLERAGTYYHLQDFDSAIIDAKRAMELGNSEARHFHKRLEQLTKG